MMEWIQNNLVELLGAIAGIVFLYLEIRQNIWLWPFGILTSAFYVYIFFVAKFYADMGLQFYYLGVSFYGWWYWLHGSKASKLETLPISHITLNLSLVLTAITFIIFLLLSYVLVNFTDSPIPYGDAFTTALSITATWMLARKILEMWWVWMVVNAVSLGLYIFKELYPTSVLFFLYFSMSILGYIHWKREVVRERDTNFETK